MSHFGEVAMPAGMLGEKCYDFIVDNDGVRYVVTEKGLFRIDPEDNSLLHLTSSWGIRGSIVSTGTLGLNDKNIWVATNEGLMIASKRNFSDKALAAIPLRIEASNLFVGQRPLSNGQLLQANDKHEIWLPWNFVAQKLVIDPTVLDYRDHQGELYEYRIDEDGEWEQQYIGQAMEIWGMTPSRHTLQLRLSGLEGSTTTYIIYVYPTWLFYLEVSLLLLSLILFIWWRSWRKRTKLLIQEHVETEDALIEEIRSTVESQESNGEGCMLLIKN
jgi:hypothetical protein